MGKGRTGWAVAVVLLLIFAGCGGADSTVSQGDYEQQLELVCNQGLQEREEAYSELSKEYDQLSEQEATAQVEDENLLKLIAVYQKTTEEISELDVPEGNEEKAEELVREREDAAAKVQADPRGTRPHFDTVFKKASQLAESFGAQACVI